MKVFLEVLPMDNNIKGLNAQTPAEFLSSFKV